MKKYYENDNIKIPKKYWKMSIEELEAEQEVIREKYKSQKPCPRWAAAGPRRSSR